MMRNKIVNMVKGAFSAATMALVLSATTMSANAAGETYGNPDGYNPVDGLMIADCYLDSQSSIDFCDPKKIQEVKKLINRNPNIGKESVLLKFWDKEMNYWVYVAVNKKTKKLFFYPRGIRSANEPYHKITLKVPKQAALCTTGTNIELVGDAGSRAYTDDSATIDYCTKFNDKTGFDVTERVDVKTGKVVGKDWI